MADIAVIFHWPLSEMTHLPADELIDWHARAIERWKASNRAIAVEMANVLNGK